MLPLSRPPLTQTSLLPEYHENHLIRVDSSLIVFFELVLRLLASDNKDQPPQPDQLKNHPIYMDMIKVIPLGFAQYVPWVHSRTFLIPATLSLKNIPERRFNFVHMYIMFLVLRILLIWAFAFDSVRIDYIWLLLLMCIILILEMYSRYFNPINNIIIVS